MKQETCAEKVNWVGLIALTFSLALGLGGCEGVLTGRSQVDGEGLSGLGPDGMPLSGGDLGPDGEPIVNCEELQTGSPPLRRLTSAQYANSVRDLLAIDIDVSDVLSSDEKIGTFASNSATPATRVVVEDYRDAAEIAAEEAISASPMLSCEDGEQAAACAERVLGSLVPRALRRPVTEEEMARYMEVYGTFAEDSHDRGLRVVVSALLQSPYFIYHFEHGVEGDVAEEGAVIPLTEHELAARLSYFALSSMPDAELRALADSGSLNDPVVAAAQAARLLRDPRALRTLDSFHAQWLGLDELDHLTRDEELFPAYTPELGPKLKEEVLAFADHVIREGDGTVATLLSSGISFADDEVLAFYGTERPAGSIEGESVLLNPDERAGLMTRAGFLAAHSHRDQGSPVARGVVVRENILCQPLPSPPPTVDDTPPDVDPNATTRERFAQHVENPSCAGCHALIDDIGLGFENYDALGQFRETENGFTVDSSGIIAGAGDVDGPFEGGVELSRRFAESDTVRDCVASQWMTFGLGRFLLPEDECSLVTIREQFAASEGSIPKLLELVAASDSFRLIQVRK